MKYFAIFVSSALFLFGCSNPSASSDLASLSEYPTLLIDKQHQEVGSIMPSPYQIGATAGIRLDATRFQFIYGTNAITPNMVYFMGVGVDDSSRSVYRLSRLTTTNIYVINGTTLETVSGSAFHGFHSGDYMFVTIGHSTLASDKEKYHPLWTGMILVK